MTIKLWDWDNNWECKITYEGHSHYVMQVAPARMHSLRPPGTPLAAALHAIAPLAFQPGQLQARRRCAVTPPPPPPRTLSRWLAWCLQAVFNPKDPNTFASASLDRSIKVWGLTSPTPHFTLEGHDKGVNCIDYFAGRAPRPPRARSAPPLRGSVRAGERRLGC